MPSPRVEAMRRHPGPLTALPTRWGWARARGPTAPGARALSFFLSDDGKGALLWSRGEEQSGMLLSTSQSQSGGTQSPIPNQFLLGAKKRLLDRKRSPKTPQVAL